MRTIYPFIAIAGAATLAGCSFSIGEPRNERVADAVQEAMEEQNIEVVSISFEEDEDDRDLYHGEATVRFTEYDNAEVSSDCTVTVNDEQRIETSECPALDGFLEARSLERNIVEFYGSQRRVEITDIAMNWQEDGSFAGSAKARIPGTAQITDLSCTGSPTDAEGNTNWECEQ